MEGVILIRENACDKITHDNSKSRKACESKVEIRLVVKVDA